MTCVAAVSDGPSRWPAVHAPQGTPGKFKVFLSVNHCALWSHRRYSFGLHFYRDVFAKLPRHGFWANTQKILYVLVVVLKLSALEAPRPDEVVQVGHQYCILMLYRDDISAVQIAH